MVKATAVYCAVSFVVVQVLYLGVWCRPIENYWAVPIPPGNGIVFIPQMVNYLLPGMMLIPFPTDQCKTYHNHLITVTVLHVSSDLAMLW